MGYIYKITNTVNNKIYIGKTNLYPPEKRWKEHLRDYKKEHCEKRPLYDAINKYGEENFVFEVIEETDNPSEREKYYIEKYRTYIGFEDCNGYNATLGGDGKTYLNLDEDDVVYTFKYICNLNAVETAEYYGCNPTTIRKILKKYNVPYYSNKVRLSLKRYLEKGLILQIDPISKVIINKYLDLNDLERTSKYEYKKGTMKNVVNGYHDSHKHNGYIWYYQNDLPNDIKEINNIK